MKRILLFLTALLLTITVAIAQNTEKNSLQQRAEEELINGKNINARALYLRAYESYMGSGQYRQAVECGTKATQLYYRESMYKEAFELLRNIEQSIYAQKLTPSQTAALKYFTTKERMQMYMKLRKGANAKEQLNAMEALANVATDEEVTNDLLYNKAIYYYTFGLTAQGNAVFKEMAAKLTGSKEYDKVDEAYRTLIANGRRSNSASLVAQSYNAYMTWKDSVQALKVADEINALKKQIADNETTIAEKDSSLTTKQVIIIALGIIAAALAAALIVGAIMLVRMIYLNRKQKKTIQLANETNALKAKFISNISEQLDPTLKKLDSSLPEVKALLGFSKNIQTLSDLENSTEEIAFENTTSPPFCEKIMDGIRDKVQPRVQLNVVASKMSVEINRDYVTHILTHLLENAAIYTPAGGAISLEFKKRGPHGCQFLVSDTGDGISEEKRDDIFKPFTEVKDLTDGDGLGLPICKQMAMKMNGDLTLDTQYTKGTRFVLDLKS